MIFIFFIDLRLRRGPLAQAPDIGVNLPQVQGLLLQQRQLDLDPMLEDRLIARNPGIASAVIRPKESVPGFSW